MSPLVFMFILSISWIMRLTILPTTRTKTFKPLDAAMATERLIPNSISALSPSLLRTALLGLEQGVKVRKTTTSRIVHVETLYGRSPGELVTLAKNLADIDWAHAVLSLLDVGKLLECADYS